MTLMAVMAKRPFDVLLSSIGLLLLMPLLGLIALCVKLDSAGPVMFRQERVGRFGQPFRIHKFRTMRHVANLGSGLPSQGLQITVGADRRITRVGHFLRASKLDELPQLLDVWLGDMSLVGPRPIVEKEAVRYGRYLQHYCAVRPGLTGLWQISGRNDVSYRRRVAYDVLYVRTSGVYDNLRILVLTVPSVLASRGSY